MRGFLLVLILAVMPFLSFAGWKVGTVLPALSGFKLEGAMPEVAGKVVLVDFWASWCGPCKASFPALNELQKEFGPKGLVVLAVNQDKTADKMKAFLADQTVVFSVVRDAGNRLVAEADVSSMPSSFLIDRKGVIRHVHSGFHGEKTKVQYRKEIEALLAEVAGGKP